MSVVRFDRGAGAWGALLFLLACGCSDGTSSSGSGVASVEITPGQEAFTAIGLTRQFSAVARDASGATISGQTFSWSSSNSSVAVVSSAGLATTTGNGAADIRATAAGVTGSATVTVSQEIDAITVSSDSVVLDRWGDTTRVTVEAVDAAGTPVESVSVSWASADEGVVSVDDDGLATSWKAGEATLTATLVQGRAAGTAATRVGGPRSSVLAQTTVTARVAVQQNSACQVPTEFPDPAPVLPPVAWDRQETFPEPPGLQDPMTTTAIALDLELDGDWDLISAFHTPEHRGVIPETEIHVRLNDGSGAFSLSGSELIGESVRIEGPRWLVYGDVNGDGTRDAIVFQQGWEILSCDEGEGACPGAPNMLLAVQPDGSLENLAQTNINPLDADGFTHSGDIADVDCDGDLDLFEGQWGSRARHHLQMNQGSGVFVGEDGRLPLGPETDEPLRTIPHGWISGSAFCDLDRDGDPDLVVGLTDRSPRVLVNDGYGRFRMIGPGVLFEEGVYLGATSDYGCADFDRNGFPDLVFSADPITRLVLNDGDMVFRDASSQLPIKDEAPYPADPVIDLNGDGWMEVIFEGGEIILWNTGGGNFQVDDFPWGAGKWAIADFDGNDRPDIAYFDPGRFGILWNR